MFSNKKGDSRRSMMEKHSKSIGIYFDKENTVYARPCGWSEMINNPVRSDIVDVLRFPYTNEDLGKFLIMSMSKCYSEDIDDNNKIGPLEKLFHVKGWHKAEIGLRLVDLSWSTLEGYHVLPWKWKDKKNGYGANLDDYIDLGKSPSNGAIAEAVLLALEKTIACK